MSIESIPVSSFMTSNVKTETEDQNIHAICKTMNENNIGSLIIMTDLNSTSQRAVGIVTERDRTHIRTTPTHFITYANKRINEQASNHPIA